MNTAEVKFETEWLKIYVNSNGSDQEQKILKYIAEVLWKEKKKKKRGNIKNFTPAVNGVRIVNGVELYRTKNNCGCGKRGHRHLKEDAEVTECHECKQELKVFPWTENDAHDEEFNYL